MDAGGSPAGGPGYCFKPTDAAGAHQDNEIMQGEVLGPVVSVGKFSAQAIARANDSDFELASSVWAKDAEPAVATVARLSCCCTWANSKFL